jgi:O-antigen ligase
MDQPASDANALAAEILFFGIATVLFLLCPTELFYGIRRAPWILALGLLATCSTAWSQDPSLTLRRSVVFAGTILFGIFFGSLFELNEQIQILAPMLLAVLLLSALVAIALPQYGVDIDDHPGCWRGLYGQRNGLAKIAVLAFLVFCVWRPSWRLSRYFAICTALAVLAMTRSATGIVVLVIMLALRQLFCITRLRLKALVPVACGLIAVGGALGLVLIDNISWLVGLLGRDLTLTGRTDLWTEVIALIRERPLLGYGYNAFWPVPTGAAGSILQHFDWVSHSHNGSLDLLLDLGAVGATVFAIGYVLAVRRAVVAYVGCKRTELLWPLAYLAFMFFYNLTESATLLPKSAFLMLYCAIVVSVSAGRARVPINSRLSALRTADVPEYGGYAK